MYSISFLVSVSVKYARACEVTKALEHIFLSEQMKLLESVCVVRAMHVLVRRNIIYTSRKHFEWNATTTRLSVCDSWNGGSFTQARTMNQNRRRWIKKRENEKTANERQKISFASFQVQCTSTGARESTHEKTSTEDWPISKAKCLHMKIAKQTNQSFHVSTQFLCR